MATILEVGVDKTYSSFLEALNNISDDILNYNVIFEDGTKKILGEIEEIVNNAFGFVGIWCDRLC